MTRRVFPSVAGALAALALCALTSCADQPVATDPGGIQAAKGGGGSGGPAVSATDPDSATQDTTLDVRVLGSGFEPGSRAEFALDSVVGPNIRTNSTRYVSSRELIANITIAADAVTDLYDVIVTTLAGKKGIGTEMFTVTKGFTLLDLGDLGYGTAGQANAVNALGHVAGYFGAQAFVWNETDGIVRLPYPAGNSVDEARGINDLDDVVGREMGSEPVLWRRQAGAWSASYLPKPGTGAAQAEDINNARLAVGVGGGNRALLWTILDTSATVEPLPELPGTTGGWARAINETGQIVGHTRSAPWEAVLWDRPAGGDWSVTRLPPPSGGTNAQAYGVSEVDSQGRLRVAGYTTIRNNSRPLRWTLTRTAPGQWQVVGVEQLSSKPGNAMGMNANGDAVGNVNGGYFWPLGGTGIALPGFPGGGGQAYGINGSRWIVGTSFSTQYDRNRPVLWR